MLAIMRMEMRRGMCFLRRLRFCSELAAGCSGLIVWGGDGWKLYCPCAFFLPLNGELPPSRGLRSTDMMMMMMMMMMMGVWVGLLFFLQNSTIALDLKPLLDPCEAGDEHTTPPQSLSLSLSKSAVKPPKLHHSKNTSPTTFFTSTIPTSTTTPPVAATTTSL